MSRMQVIVLCGFLLCVALMLLNADFYYSGPGHGLNLFAAIWCGVMALFNLWTLGRTR